MGQLFDVAVLVGRVDAWVTLCCCCLLASFVVAYGLGAVDVDAEGKVTKPREGAPRQEGRLPVALVAACLSICCAVLYVVVVSKSKTAAAGAGVFSFADAVTSW